MDKRKKKAGEAYKHLFCQYCRLVLYIGYWILGMNNVPQEYRNHIKKRYGLEVGDDNGREIDLTKKTLLEKPHKWKRFTLSEFNHVNRERLAAVPSGVFSYLCPQAWRKLRSALEKTDAAYAKTKKEILEDNLGLVYSMLNKAVRYRNLDGIMSLSDGNSEAYIASSRALDHFLLGRGKLSTYMAYKIENAVKETLDKNMSSIKTPGYVQRTLRKVLSASDEFEELHGRSPTPVELADMTGHPKSRIEMLLNTDLNNLVSLDSAVGDEDGETKLHEMIAAPEDNAVSPIDPDLISELLKDLTPRERHIISYRFGLVRVEALAREGVRAKMALGAEAINNLCESGRKLATYQFRKLQRNG